MPLGPAASNHVWSTSCVAIDCPKNRLSFGISRWIIAGKKPNMFEKWCTIILGITLNCLLVRAVSSIAMSRPIMVTSRAASLRVRGMLMTGVFEGKKFAVIINPATILPQASRLMGLITEGLFSLMGDKGRNRGEPIVTKYTTRKL